MTMTERLLEATKEIWDGYNETPFVKGIADGSLDHEKFKYYMIQDQAGNEKMDFSECDCAYMIVKWSQMENVQIAYEE